jgi:hypothetical protein
MTPAAAAAAAAVAAAAAAAAVSAAQPDHCPCHHSLHQPHLDLLLQRGIGCRHLWQELLQPRQD